MKVVELLKTLNESELIRFEKFINSPYHNEIKDIVQVYNGAIAAIVKSNKDQKLIKATFIQKTKWSDLKFRKTCNQLLELLLSFNTIEFNQKKPLINEVLRFQSMVHRQWEHFFSNRINRIKHFKLKKSAWTEIELAHYYIYLKSHIDSNSISIDESLNAYAEIAQTKKEFNKISDLSSFIDLENLRHNNLALSYQHYRHLTLFDNYLIKAYQLVVDIFKGEIQPTDQQIKTNLQEFLPRIDPNDASNILDLITSFFILKQNKGDLTVTSTIFELYKLGLELNLFKIFVGNYRNIAYFACREGNFEWALDFVEKYKTALPKNDQDSAYSFTKSRTLWYAKDWEGVIRTLRNVEYKDMTYNLLARSYILTCYYELDDYEPLDSLIKSFKVYLRRKRNVSVERKDSFYNFITALDHLMKASERSDYKRILKAKVIIANNPSTRNKDWLTEKIEELEAIIPQPKSKSRAKA